MDENASQPNAVRKRMNSIAAVRYPALSGYASITRGFAWICLVGSVLIGLATIVDSENIKVVESLVVLSISGAIGYALFVVIGASGDFARAVMDIAALGIADAERDRVVPN